VYRSHACGCCAQHQALYRRGLDLAEDAREPGGGGTAPGDWNFTRVRFPNLAGGWLLGSDAQGNSIVLKTTNGGGSWQQLSPPLAGTYGLVKLDGLEALDADRAWLGGNQGTILRTTNGGVDWERVGPTTPTGSISAYRELSFSNAGNGSAPASTTCRTLPTS
jgi:photosystem II stability/assembly factor-like uncharacterized protein